MDTRFEEELDEIATLFSAEENGRLSILEFSIIIPKKSDKVTYSFEEIVEAYHTFQWDRYWWAMISDNMPLKLEAKEAQYLEKWKQIVAFPPFQHIVRVISREGIDKARVMRTVAIPEGRAGIQMSYLAEYIVEDLGDTVKISLVGKLQIPASLQTIVQSLTKLIGAIAFKRSIKKFFYSGKAKNLLALKHSMEQKPS